MLALLSLLWSLPVWACGPLTLSFSALDLEWSTTSPQVKKFFEVRRAPPYTPCSYFVTFSRGAGPSFEQRQAKSGSFSLPYQIYSHPSSNPAYVLKDLDSTQSSTQFVTGSFDSSQNNINRHEIYVGLPFTTGNDPFLPHYGLYSDNLTGKVYSGAPGGADSTPQHMSTLPVSIWINRVADLSIGPPGSVYQQGRRHEKIDFGELRQGASRSIDLRVVTNAGFRIYLSSQNGGKLVHERKEIKTAVPYEMRVNSSVIPLHGSDNHPVLAAEGRGTSRLSGLRNEVRVTILDVANKMAGLYRDVVTFEVKAVE